MNKPDSRFPIGEIVTLKNNFLFSESFYTNISIAGDTDYLSPLMIITESLDVSTGEIDEFEGDEKLRKGRFQYLCMWFSKSDFKFEQKWFFENELKAIKVSKKKSVIQSLKFGDKVIFKTHHLEIQKRRINFSQKNSESNFNQTHALNFVSPVFMFIGYKKTEKKEPEFDTKTNMQKRWYPTKMVKIKAFCQKENKFSELIVPLETVDRINQPDDIVLNEIIDIINFNKLSKFGQKYIEYKASNYEVERPMIPHNLIVESGIYSIIGQDLFSQQIITFKLDGEFKLNSRVLSIDATYPEFKIEKDDVEINFIKDYLKGTEPELIKISYKNFLGKYSQRFVLVEKRLKFNDETGSSVKGVFYLKGFCLLREDLRHFKEENIQRLEIINDEYLIKVAEEIKSFVQAE